MQSKTKQWIKDRSKLISLAIGEGKIEIKNGVPQGTCPDCHEYKMLEPDHKLKRSQGGGNENSNIEWVCRRDHDRRDNQGDPLNKKERNTKKASWALPHKCNNCGMTISFLLCPHCKT